MKKLLLLLAAVGMIFTACDKGDFGDNGNPSEGGVVLDPNNPLNNYKCASNEILYISKSCLPMELNTYDGWGANLTSNTYDNGVGRLKFDGNVTAIPGGAFKENDLLRYIKMPNTITKIGYESFYKCSSLKSVVIPDSVTSIGYYAFEYCSSLKSVTIGNGVTSIRESAFSVCRSLTSVHISDLSAWCKISFENPYANPLCHANHLYLNGNEVAELIIPSDITSIGRYAFYNCYSLRSITIPDSVTEIGEEAFSGCTGELIINSKIIETDYTYDKYPSDYGGWLEDSKFTKLTIGNNITKIGDYAFRDCSSLTSVTIGNGVTSIGRFAFRDCSNLTAFYGKFASSDNRCLIVEGVLHSFAPAGLTEYTIPDSVTSIGGWAFYNCTSLASVTIGDSVTSIESYAFYDCTSLKEVYCMPIVPPSLGSSVFKGNATDRIIYVPVNSVSRYQTNWGSYEFAITYEGGPLPLKVGDLVSKNGATGVVYYATDYDLQIVSVEETYTDRSSAETWCSNYGSGWDLPGKYELEIIYSNKSTINSTLSANGYITIGTGSYWASECINTSAYYVDFKTGASSTTNKSNSMMVRAVFVY